MSAWWNMVTRLIGVAMIAFAVSSPGRPTAATHEQRPESSVARAAWPDNEPEGLTPILTVDGSSKDWPGFRAGRAWLDDSKVGIVSDRASKYGKAIEKRFRIGDKAGWHGAITTQHLPGGPFRELYYRIVFRLSPTWQWHPSGGKYFYYGTVKHATRGYLGWDGSGRPTWVDFGSGVGLYRPNDMPPISRDRYHTIELHHGASTNGTNGFLRMWVDGVEVERFNLVGNPAQKNVQLVNREWRATKGLADKRLDALQAFMYWGGQGNAKRVNDWIRLSELYISGKK